jgi:kinesin family protein 26
VFSDRGVGFTVGSRRRDGKTRSEVEASSGYESMIRDSEEVTGTSSNQDSANESQSIAKLKGTKTFRKRVKGRSRSVPTRGHLPDGSHIPRPWAGFLEEPVEIKVYDVDDVERMTRWRQQEAEVYQLQSRRQRIQELLDKQKLLKRELSEAKAMLMVDSSSWSYDLHVAEDFQRDDSDYLAALETETAILEKRVRACRSRIMVVTVFDITAG